MSITSFHKIHLLENDPSPMYQKIKEHILERIALGEWLPQQKIPSENEIAAILNISRMTVNRAFKELTEEGYLFREKGAGTFVAEPFQLIPFFELMPISQEMAIEGNLYRAQILRLCEEESPSLIWANRQDQLMQEGMLMADHRFYSEIIYCHQHDPLQFEKRSVLRSFAPNYLQETFQKMCTTTYLHSINATLSQQHTLEAIIPNQELCDLLAITPDIACFKVKEILQVNQQVVSYAEQYYPASRYQFHSKIL